MITLDMVLESERQTAEKRRIREAANAGKPPQLIDGKKQVHGGSVKVGDDLFRRVVGGWVHIGVVTKVERYAIHIDKVKLTTALSYWVDA